MENEKRLIDADALEEDLVTDIIHIDTYQLQRFIYHIHNQPTVDATPIVRGFWKKKWHDNNLIGHEYEECSACGSCIISDTEKFWDCNYCPNCGAKMDGERKDNG